MTDSLYNFHNGKVGGNFGMDETKEMLLIQMVLENRSRY